MNDDDDTRTHTAAMFDHQRSCPYCIGTGVDADGDFCPACDGSGVRPWGNRRN
jgi:DnaJ-class molecular chaperone